MTVWIAAWLWQGTALTLLVAAALRLAPRLNARTRHLLWWATLAALVWLGYSTAPTAGPELAAPGARSAAESLPAIELDPIPHWLLSSVVAVWLVVALTKLLKIFPAIDTLHRFQDECSEFPPDVEEELPMWKMFGREGRRARLVVSDQIDGPAVLGLFHPCIAVPSKLVRALEPGELDQIIAHEYAHVQRRDDWLRLIQVLLDSALWIHPAARWIGRCISFERELACDAWVVSQTKTARGYARCLAHTAELQMRRPQVQLLSTGFFERKRDLIGRVNHLLTPQRARGKGASIVVASFGLCAIAAATTSLRAFPGVAERLVIDGIPTVGRPLLAVPKHSLLSSWQVSGGEGVVEAVVDGDVLERTARPGPPPRAAGLQSDPTTSAEAAHHAVNTSDASAAVTEPAGPALVGGRIFHASYKTPGSPAVSADSRKTPGNGWGSAGTAIGSTSRDASVGLAGAFTRAGVSIARSFR